MAYLPWNTEADDFTKSLRVQLVESHHLTLLRVQCSLRHNTKPSLSVRGVIDTEIVDVWTLFHNLNVADVAISLQGQRQNVNITE